jgi:hypothetical protein
MAGGVNLVCIGVTLTLPPQLEQAGEGAPVASVASNGGGEALPPQREGGEGEEWDGGEGGGRIAAAAVPMESGRGASLVSLRG